MSGFTITAGVSFSGGFTFTEAPVGNAWFGGGNGPVLSTVDRITFATDTNIASVRGPLSAGRYYFSATGNTDYAWFGGGTTATNPQIRSTVDRITYATDTETALVRGPLSQQRYGAAAAGNTYNGWWAGGFQYIPGSPGPDAGPFYYSRVDRITYATDTATASVRGPLSGSRRSATATGNETDGWFGGGVTPGPLSTVDRITYATDTATASVRGPLSLARANFAAAGNATNGWFGGGPGYSRVDRITYATDTATASVRGPLSAGRHGLAAAGSTTDGWFGGGYSPYVSLVDRITYATDTDTASVRGPLSQTKFGLAAASNISLA